METVNETMTDAAPDYEDYYEVLSEGIEYKPQEVDHSMHHGMDHGAHGHHGGHGGHDHSGHNMAMNFHFNHKGVIFLFESFTIQETSHLFLYCLITLGMGILVEGIKHYRIIKVNARLHGNQSNHKILHIYDSLLHFAQTTIGYLLMLIAMTYHYALFLCAMSGIAVGYWMFNKPEPEDFSGACPEKSRSEKQEMIKRGSITQDSCGC